VAALTATATCTAFRAVAEATGELVPARLLAERVRLLAALTQELATAVVAARWNDGDLATLKSGVGPDGRTLPAKGWMALRRLGWAAAAPEGVHVSDRVRRAAEEAAARALRSAVHRRAVVHAILESWPADPWRRTDAEWAALRKRLPQGVSTAEIRNRTRQLRAFRTGHHGRPPAGLTELETAPRIPALVVLAAADKQLVTIQPTGAHAAVLRVQLPLTGRPTSPTQWAWHAIRLAVPEHVPACASLCAPTLRLVEGRVRVDLPWRLTAPSAPRAGHTVALGLDWGVNTLLTGTVGKLAVTPTGSRVVTDGRMLRFAATGVSAKLHRLRGHRQTIATRRDHHARLLDGLPEDAPDRAALTTKHAVLEVQHERVCAPPQPRPGLGGRPLGRGPGQRARRQRHLSGGPGHAGDPRPPQGQRAAVRAGPRHRGRRGPAPCRQSRHRHRHRPGAWHLQALPTLRQTPAPRPGPRPPP
jgi:hypothetical protein